MNTGIASQSIKPYEIIVTTKGNIAEGRNEYLRKAQGDYIACFDMGCYYPPNYSEMMIKKLEDENADIVIGVVRPKKPSCMIQEFCALRLPQYDRFTKADWDNFIPSNRQVIFKRDIIKRLGLIPTKFYRSDDTYWFRKAKEIGLKFAYCQDAVVYWEGKRSLYSYLKTVYNDNKCDKKFKIKGFQAAHKISPLIFPYGFVVSIIAGIAKIIARIT